MSDPYSKNQQNTSTTGDTRIVDLLRDIEAEGRDARIWVESEFGIGEVFVHAGQMVQARLGGARGRTALLRMLALTDARCGMEPCAVTGGEPLISNVQELVELHTVRLAEWQELCARAPGLGSVLKLSTIGTEVRDSSRGIQRVVLALIDGQRTLMQVLAESSFDPVQSLRIVTKAIDEELVQLVPATSGESSGVLPRVADVGPPTPSQPSVSLAPVSNRGWRNATLVGIGRHPVTSALSSFSPVTPERSNTDLRPSPIVSLDAEHTETAQVTGAPGAQPPIRTKTVVGGFGVSETRSEVWGGTSKRAETGSSIPYEYEASRSLERTARGVVLEQSSPSGNSRPAASANTPGDTVEAPTTAQSFVDRYEILLRIGQGGMGTVYLCRLSSGAGFRRLFALKLLRSHLVKDEQAAKDFLEEARVAGYLHHANVVAVSDAGFHGKQPYLVMDYVEGCSLKELLKNSPKPEPRFVLPVILDVLAGLHAVHSLQDESGTALNLVHCDVSPENLLVGVDGISRLTDFGVVRRASNGLSVSTKGKPGYASPELIRGDSFDRRADIFSMGVVLWNCLTGEKLFSADSIEETVEQVCSKPIPAPSTLLPNLPSDIDAVVMKALARNPKTRYSSAEEMLLALRDASRRLGELATGGEIAQWVRSVADDEFSKRRLAILDASRHPTVPPDAEAQEPLSVAVPLVSTTASEPPDIESNTVAFAVSPRRGRRIALLVAGLLAIVAVVATLMFPRVVASFFRLNTDPVALPEQGQFDIGTFRDSPAPSGSVETSPVPQGSAGARVVPGGSKGKQGL